MKKVLSILTRKESIKLSEDNSFWSKIKATDYTRITGDFSWENFWLNDRKLVAAKIISLNEEPKKIIIEYVASTTYEKGILPVIKDRKTYEKLNYLCAGSDSIQIYEYPNSVENEDISSMLDKLLTKGFLLKTGRSFDGHPEYYYNGQKYIQCYSATLNKLPNNRTIHLNQNVWIKVEPLEWINNRKLKMFICTNILSNKRACYDLDRGDITKAEIYSSLEQMYNEMTKKIDIREELLLNDNDLNNPLKFIFISNDDIFGENNTPAVDTFNITISDFAKYTGDCDDYYTKNRFYDKSSLKVGYLPAINYSLIKDSAKLIINKQDDSMLVEFGEYPLVEENPLGWVTLSSIVSKNEEKYKTGKIYTYYKHFTSSNEKPNNFKKAIEYEINGHKYARTEDDIWFIVEKLRWSVDLKRDLACCLSVPFAGLDYDLNGNVEETDLNRFIIKYFSKEIIPSRKRNINKINQMVSDDILTQMIMNKENIEVEDLEIDGDSKLILRR